MATKRNPDRTRARILSAALHEFASKGFAGARVDAIARRARSNKRMLYHYFGDKRGLFEATVRSVLDDKARSIDVAPRTLEDGLPYLFDAAMTRPEWTRMMQWEALAYGEREVLAEAERRAALSRAVQRVAGLQAEEGVLPGEEPEHLLLALMALTSYPYLMPQVARMVTGVAPSDPRFRRAYGRVLRAVARMLSRPEADARAPAAEPSRAKARSGARRRKPMV